MRSFSIAALLALGVACTGSSDVPDDKDDETADETASESGTEETETDESYYGPDNEWWHALASEVPSELAGTGSSAGDIIENFTMTDQNGDDVELYQFYGQVLQIVLLAEW